MTVQRRGPSPEDQRRACDAVLRSLAGQTGSGEAGSLAYFLSRRNVAAREISAYHDWAAPPARTLLVAARQNSTLADWLAALPLLPREGHWTC